MSFISVLLAYLLSRYTGVAAWLHRDGWLVALLDMAAGGKTQTVRPFLLVPVAGSLLLALLLGYLPFWTAFFCGLILLLFSTGRGSWRADITNLPAQLQAGKAETLWLALQDEGTATAAEAERRDGFLVGEYVDIDEVDIAELEDLCGTAGESAAGKQLGAFHEKHHGVLRDGLANLFLIHVGFLGLIVDYFYRIILMVPCEPVKQSRSTNGLELVKSHLLPMALNDVTT